MVDSDSITLAKPLQIASYTQQLKYWLMLLCVLVEIPDFLILYNFAVGVL